MGFSVLRVINEDRVAPGAGFPPHRHANMEILSYVLDGVLAHRDSISDGSRGGGGELRPGELQWMSAGHGIEHSEYNASRTAPVHFLQIWIQPDRLNARPAYAQQVFEPAARRGRWGLLASPDGADGSLAIRQQAWLRGVVLGAGDTVEAVVDPSRNYWLHVAQGSIEVDGRVLSAGDALGYVDEAVLLQLRGAGESLADVLLFDLPG
jgi:redox-sensitive bicupin YhaK (pirin superfamily)